MKIVVNNTNFDSFLVVKKVLCASICTPRMDLFRTSETIFVPGFKGIGFITFVIFFTPFHTLGIHFIPKWAVFIPGAGFSYLFGIIKKVWYEIVCLSTAMVFFHTKVFWDQCLLFYFWDAFHTYLVWKNGWGMKLISPVSNKGSQVTSHKLFS